MINKRLLAIILAFVMLSETVPAALVGSGLAELTGMISHAASVSEDSRFAGVITGEYQYASNESLKGNILETDKYRYSDRWFTRSSYDLNWQLADMSACAAISTASYYKDDEHERNHESNSQNVKALLKSIGFRDVETNAYYDLEEEENSMACIVGYRTLNIAGRKYTLLAVFPRSAGYKQEWSGNFTVGNGKMHQGFKAARDEILRFVKGYITRNGIRGDLKVWIAGHSRGGANANLLGGFFAEGGGGYFDGVNISPEDVYCYSFATPTSIRDGLTKREALSVEGYRGTANERYINDSRTAAFTYAGADADTVIKPHEGVYRCVHNCKPGYDVITQLPPHSWGFDWYGADLQITDGSAATKARMKAELKKINAYALELYEDGGDEEDFKWKTFDFAALDFVDDESCDEPISQEIMCYQRINSGIIHRADTLDGYVNNGYQDTFRATAAIYGMGFYQFMDGLLEDKVELIKTTALAYLCYASERILAERDFDPGLSDKEKEKKAVAIAVEELIEYITNEEIDPDEYTVDDFVVTFAKFIVDNADYEVHPKPDADDGDNEAGGGQDNDGDGDQDEIDPESIDDIDIDIDIFVKDLKFRSKTAEEVFKAIASYIISSIPEEYSEAITALIESFGIEGYDSDDPTSPQSKEAVVKFVFTFLHQCAYGDGDREDPDKEDAANKRQILYLIISFVMGSSYDGITDIMARAAETDASELLDIVIQILIDKKDTEGANMSIAEAADEYLSGMIERGIGYVLTPERYEEGSVYYEDVQRHGAVLKANVTKLRQTLLDLVLFEENEDGDVPFSTERTIRTVSTFISQANKIPLAHYNEIYIAWMRAQATAEESRKDVIAALRLLGQENKNKVSNSKDLEVVILRAIDAVREAEDKNSIEQIFTDAKADVDALIKAKEKDDRDAADKDAADAAAADKVKALIDALPDAEKVTTADKAAIEAARAAYDSLTAGQKARISESMLRKLTDAEYALREAEKSDKRTITALILTGTTYKYNGKTQKPAIAYVIAGDRIVGPDGYDVSYSDSDSADAGDYTVTVTGKDQYTGIATADYTISKASNPVKIKARKVTVKYASVNRRSKTVKRSRAIRISKAKGKVTYKLRGVKASKYRKYFKINKKTGNIKIRKGLGKGTYRVKVKVTSSGAPNYNAKSKNVTIKITVK